MFRLTLSAHQFLRAGRLIPSDQELVTLEAGTGVRDALSIMRAKDFDQVPILNGGKTVGVFSYRSLARHLGFMRSQDDPMGLLVEDVLEDLPFIRAVAELDDAIRGIESHGAVLIGDEANLLAIATASDVGALLWGASRPFFIVQDIELAVRSLMHRASADSEELEACLAAALSHREDRRGMLRLEDLSYGDLIAVLTQGEQFRRVFSRTFGRQRPLVMSILDPVRDVRNKIVHFRDEITADELQILVNARAWVQRKVALSE